MVLYGFLLIQIMLNYLGDKISILICDDKLRISMGEAGRKKQGNEFTITHLKIN